MIGMMRVSGNSNPERALMKVSPIPGSEKNAVTITRPMIVPMPQVDFFMPSVRRSAGRTSLKR